MVFAVAREKPGVSGFLKDKPIHTSRAIKSPDASGIVPVFAGVAAPVLCRYHAQRQETRTAGVHCAVCKQRRSDLIGVLANLGVSA